MFVSCNSRDRAVHRKARSKSTVLFRSIIMVTIVYGGSFVVSGTLLPNAAYSDDECGIVTTPGTATTIECDGITGNAGSDGSVNVTAGSDLGDVPLYTGTQIRYANIGDVILNIGSDGAAPLVYDFADPTTYGAVGVHQPDMFGNVTVNIADNVDISASSYAGVVWIGARTGPDSVVTINSFGNITNTRTGSFSTVLQVQPRVGSVAGGTQTINASGSLTSMGEANAAMGIWNFNNNLSDLIVNSDADITVGTGGGTTAGTRYGIYAVDFGASGDNVFNPNRVEVNLTGGSITMNTPTVDGVNISGDGVYARGAGGSVHVSATNSGTITTTGRGAAIRATSGQRQSGFAAADVTVNVEGWTLATSGIGGRSYGIYASNNNINGGGTSVAVSDATIATEARSSSAIFAQSSNSGGGMASVTVSNSSMTTQGANSHGVYVSQRSSGGELVIDVIDSSIDTIGTNAHGISASQRGMGSLVIDTSGAITTAGNFSRGISGTSHSDTDSSISTYGSIDTSGNNAAGIYAQQRAAGTFAINAAGAISTAGESAVGIYGWTTAGGTVSIDASGTLTTSGDMAHGIRGASGTTDTVSGATVDIDASGTISTTGAGAHAIVGDWRNTIRINPSATYGTPGEIGDLIDITVSGDVSATGADSDGIKVLSVETVWDGTAGWPSPPTLVSETVTATPYQVAVNSGSVTGGSGFGAAIHTVASGGAVDVAAGAVIDGSASGTAFRDGDMDYNGVDRVGGDVVISTAGAVTGNAILGLGGDVFNLTGGTMSGDIYGDDMTASADDGNDTFHWLGGDLNGGFYGGNGSDIALIDGSANYQGDEILDGGDDADVADGWIDELTVDGISVVMNSGSVLNWEYITFTGGAEIALPGMLSTDRLTISGNSRVEMGTVFALTGDLSVESGSTLSGFGGGIGTYELNGDVANHGLITLADGAAGDTLRVGGTYSGTGAVALDVDFATASADGLHVAGNVEGGPKGLIVYALNGNAADGSDIELVQVEGSQGSDAFTLVGGGTVMGMYDYSLINEDTVWSLRSSGLNSSAVASMALPMSGLIYTHRWQGQWHERMGSFSASKHRNAWLRAKHSAGDLEAAVNTAQSYIGADWRSWFVEAGGDLISGPLGAHGRVEMGLMGGKGNSSANAWDMDGGVSTEGRSAGLYVTWTDQARRYYVDFAGRYHWLEFAGLSLNDQSWNEFTGHGSTFSLEAGKTFTSAGGIDWQPQVQYTHGLLKHDRLTGGNGLTTRLIEAKSRVWRVGVRIDKEYTGESLAIRPFASVDVEKETGGPVWTEIAENAVSVDFNDTWVYLAGGVNLLLNERARFFAQTQWGAGDRRASDEVEVRLGFDTRF